MLNRLTLFVSGKPREYPSSAEPRDRCDRQAPDRRAVTVGAEMRLTGNTSVDVSVTRSHLEYDANSLYLGTDLAQVLNHRASGESVAIRYAATPLTTFGVEASRIAGPVRLGTRPEFRRAADHAGSRVQPVRPGERAGRDRISTGAHLTTVARQVGIYRSERARRSELHAARPDPLHVAATPQSGVSRTCRVCATTSNRASSDRSPSALESRGTWLDVSAVLVSAIARAAPRLVATAQIPNETVITSGVDVGYNIRRTRIGLYVEHDRRDTDLAAQFRGYRRFRIGSSATYVF